MTYFKLNIPRVNENIFNYRKYKSNTLDDLEFTYNLMSNADSAWNDSNAYDFIEQIKKDKYNINEYFDFLDGLYDEIDAFKNFIGNLCSKYGYSKNSSELKFDDSNIENCKKNINNIIYYLNLAYNNLSPYKFIGKFDSLWIIYDLRNEIQRMKLILQTILNNINNFSRSINDELVESKSRVKKKNSFNFNIKPIEYTWSVKDINIKFNNVELDSIMNATGSTVKTSSTNVGKQNVYSNYAQSSTIEKQEIDEIKGITDTSKIAQSSTIEKQETDEIKGITDTSKIAQSREIKKIETVGISDLTNGINKDNEKNSIIQDFNINLNEIKSDSLLIDSNPNKNGMKIEPSYPNSISDIDITSSKENTINFSSSNLNSIESININDVGSNTIKFSKSSLNPIENINANEISSNTIDFNANNISQIDLNSTTVNEHNINFK